MGVTIHPEKKLFPLEHLIQVQIILKCFTDTYLFWILGFVAYLKSQLPFSNSYTIIFKANERVLNLFTFGISFMYNTMQLIKPIPYYYFSGFHALLFCLNIDYSVSQVRVNYPDHVTATATLRCTLLHSHKHVNSSPVPQRTKPKQRIFQINNFKHC
jgi:hypothetical protein